MMPEMDLFRNLNDVKVQIEDNTGIMVFVGNYHRLGFWNCQ